jgi:hypothetical protein
MCVLRPTETDRATLRDLATRVRAVAVDVLPRWVKPWNPSPDPLAGLCGFAATGIVSSAAELGYTGGVLQGLHSRGSHLWARFDCGLDVDITGPQFGLPPVLVMNRTEARGLRYRYRTRDRDWLMRPHEYDVRAYARRYGCAWFPVNWWRAALERREAA